MAIPLSVHQLKILDSGCDLAEFVACKIGSEWHPCAQRTQAFDDVLSDVDSAGLPCDAAALYILRFRMRRANFCLRIRLNRDLSPLIPDISTSWFRPIDDRPELNAVGIPVGMVAPTPAHEGTSRKSIASHSAGLDTCCCDRTPLDLSIA